MVSLGPSSSYHNQNHSVYRSASAVTICYPGYVCNLDLLICLILLLIGLEGTKTYHIFTRDNFEPKLLHLLGKPDFFFFLNGSVINEGGSEGHLP